MSSPYGRSRYLEDGMAHMSPQKLVVKLYERMLRDFGDAEDALLVRNHTKAHDALCHAQEIILELQASLKPDVWSGSKQLQSLYAYVLDNLVQANVKKDARRVAECRQVIQPLYEAWKEALRSIENGAAEVGAPPVASDTTA